MKLVRYNPAKTFGYYIIDKKRVGRGHFIRGILCGKDTRLCSNKKSIAKTLIDNKKPYYLTIKDKKLNLEGFDSFFISIHQLITNLL